MLGALTDEVQRRNQPPASSPAQKEPEREEEPSIVQAEDTKNAQDNLDAARVILTTKNTNRLDLLRVSSGIWKNVPRSRVVNQILEQYFADRCDRLTADVQSVLESLQE